MERYTLTYDISIHLDIYKNNIVYSKKYKLDKFTQIWKNRIIISQVQKIPNFAYQIFQTLQIYWVYEKDDIKYKYDRKWKTENMAEKHNFQE